MSKKRINGCILCLPTFIGFILGGLFCLIICLLSGCHSQKKVVETVSLDSVAQTTEAASTCVNSEATSIKNLSLQFDSLEILYLPPFAPTSGATGGTLVAPQAEGESRDASPYSIIQPIYLRASRASLASESAQKSTVDSSSAVRNDASIDVRSRSDRSEDIDTTAVAKPPDMNWIIIAILTGIIILLLITNFTKKK